MRKLTFLLLCLILVASLCHARAFVQDGTWRDGVTLDGVTQYISVPASASVKGLTAATYECRVKFPSLPFAAGINKSLVWEGTSDTDYSRFGIQCTQGASTIYGVMRDSDNGTAILTGTYAVTTGRWYDVALTVDTVSTDYLNLYVDGILVASNTATKGAFTSGAPNQGPFIGKTGTSGSNAKCQIKNFRIWNYARTASEIQRDASLRLTGNEPGLVYYMPGDQGLNEDPTLPTSVFPPSSFDSASPNVLKLTGSTGNAFATSTSSITAFPVTLSAWVKATGVSNGTNYCYVGIASGSTNTRYLAFNLTGDGSFNKIRPVMRNDSTIYAITSAPSVHPADKWTYVTVVYLSATVRKIYADGALTTTDTGTVNFPGSMSDVGIGVIRSSPALYTDGYVKHASIWTRELTQAEIQACMNSSAPPTTTALIGWWSLNETTGSTAYDIGPNGYNGVITGGSRVSLTPKTVDPVSFKSYPAFAGRYGAARTLLHDGVNDKTVIPASATFKAATAATMCGWINVPTYPAASAAIWREDIAAGNASRFSLSVNPTGGMYMGMRDNDAGSFIFGPRAQQLPPGNCTHVACVVDTVADTQTMYVNGYLASQVSVVMGPFPDTWPFISTIAFDGTTYAKVYTFDFGKWSRALTPQEIQAQMYADYPVSTSGLIGFWPMNEGTGNCADISGNGNTAVVTGATWSTLSSNNGSIMNSSVSWQRTLINAFPPSFRSYLVTP